ncbi:MAG: hypothetical protein FJW94_12990, partial [Actinobacteria bacterium]|nr:hypothetical protein [Actinomycetota bacterium]
AALSVCAALVDRGRTGLGCRIDVSMTDVLVTWANPDPGGSLASSDEPGGNFPAYGTFACREGWVTLGVVTEDHFWRALCAELGLEDLADLGYLHAMTTPRILAAATVLVLASLLAACGGNDESSSPTTTAAAGEEAATTTTAAAGEEAATTTTASPSDGSTPGSAPTGGGSSEFCALSIELESTVFNAELSPDQQFTAEQKELFEQVKAAAPAEISESISVVLDTYAEQGYGMEAMQDPAFTGAGQEVSEYLDANCREFEVGGSDVTTGSDEGN